MRLIAVAARDLALEVGIEVGACSWWSLADEELIAAGALDIGRLPGHAGAFESSLVLALDESLVREPRPHRDEDPTVGPDTVNAKARIERPGSWQAIEGFTDSPDAGRADLGREFFDVAIKKVAATMAEFFAGSVTGGSQNMSRDFDTEV